MTLESAVTIIQFHTSICSSHLSGGDVNKYATERHAVVVSPERAVVVALEGGCSCLRH